MRPTLKKLPFPPKGHQARSAPRLMSISSCHLLCITGPSTKRSPGAPSRPIALHLLNGDEQSADLSRSSALSSLNIFRNRGVKIFHRNENFRREEAAASERFSSTGGRFRGASRRFKRLDFIYLAIKPNLFYVVLIRAILSLALFERSCRLFSKRKSTT